MNHRTLKRLGVLAPLVVSLAVIGVGLVNIARRSAPIIQPQTLEHRAKELQAILVILRTTHNTQVFCDTEQRLMDWMARNLVRGRTTKANIVTYFGKVSQDLDRPPRDYIRSLVYPLYGDSRYSGGDVVFCFNPRTAILQDWHFSHWICGFCPHVLADDGRWRLEGKCWPAVWA